MGSLSFAVDNDTRKMMLKELNKREQDVIIAVDELTDWFEAQVYLPEVPSKKMLEFILIYQQFDIESVKRIFDAYYTFRTTMKPVFGPGNPNSKEMKIMNESCYVIPLPKLVENKYGVIVIREKSVVPYGLDINWWTSGIVNTFEVRMQEGPILNTILIYDHENLSMSHVMKITPGVLMNCVRILEILLNDRVKEFHFIHCPTVFQVVLKLCKSLMKPELYNKFIFHDTAETLSKYISVDILPKDYYGNERSLEELQGLWIEKQKEYQDRFDKRDTLVVNENLRPPSGNQTGIGAIFNKFMNF